jgi:hypothetical protein
MIRAMLSVSALVLFSASISPAQGGFPAGTSKPFGEVVSHAEAASVLHEKHTHPYHLKASIVETTNPQSEYHGEIEEFFQSEKNWRRTVTAPGLVWTQEMRGGHISDEYTEDYAPLWLRELLSGIGDPLPQREQLERMQQPIRVIEGAHSSSCMRNLPGDLQVCIDGEHGGFGFIMSDPGGLEFHDYQPFHKKWIARKLISNPESGTTLQLTITELSDLKDPTPAAPLAPSPAPLIAVEVSQSVMQVMLKSDAHLNWPPIKGGKTNGFVHVFLGIGPDGKVREVWPGATENGDMEDFARQQIRGWQFTPYLLNGRPIAVSTHWSIPFETKIGTP